MWQLELLSKVVPAFGALAKRHTERESRKALLQSATDCYSDITFIGHAISVSRGESVPELHDDTILTDLLRAFATRIPRRWDIRNAFSQNWDKAEAHFDRTELRQLEALAKSIGRAGMGGYDECSEISNQSREQHQQYLVLLTTSVSLFKKNERYDADKREKFLKRIKVACIVLKDAYFPANRMVDAEHLDLTRHPCYRLKSHADRVYEAFEQHWRCDEFHQKPKSTGTREIRLGLVRHRRLKAPSVGSCKPNTSQAPIRFEVLLPFCEEKDSWQTADVKVESVRPQLAVKKGRLLIEQNLCDVLNDKNVRIDLIVDREGFWHMKPLPVESGKTNLATMKPLHELLGDDMNASYVSKCNPRDQLILCYIMASSMLYLYPGSWVQAEWSSRMVHFMRHSSSTTSSLLTRPYVSVVLSDARLYHGETPHMYAHEHPAVLALGIMFLEIFTGKEFEKSKKASPSLRCNEDIVHAEQVLATLIQNKRPGRAAISPGTYEAIKACLRLQPPSNSSTNDLTADGPIRQYILSCIAHPLGQELENGYCVKIEDLDELMIPESAEEMLDHAMISCDQIVGAEGRQVNNTLQNQLTQPRRVRFGIIKQLEEEELASLSRGREQPVDEAKADIARKWFESHDSILHHISKMEARCKIAVKPIKIAILDSGIALSEEQMIYYSTEPSIIYRDWVDGALHWKDDVGHGTHLAVLLRMVAPSSVIHVARVFRKDPTWQSADTIADAMWHAVDEWDVDIVVMAFGFSSRPMRLQKAIQHAASKGVLMFAAASNDGLNHPDGVAWPAHDINVICVHSGDGHGKPSAYTPAPQDSMRIMVLGESVRSAWPPQLNHRDGYRLMSGTSCAAPIAAGLAAVVLGYARTFLSGEQWMILRGVTSMRRIFECMTNSPGHNVKEYIWIVPGMLFDTRRAEGWVQEQIRKACGIDAT